MTQNANTDDDRIDTQPTSDHISTILETIYIVPDSNTDATPEPEQAPQTPPVEEGEQRTVEIENIGDQEDGITRIERGFVVTVPDITRTEIVDVRTTCAGGDRQKKQLMTDGGSPTDDMGVFTSSKTDEWATPPEFLRPLAEAVGGFDLDAAAGAEESPIAESVYTEDDDGLAQPWFGTVWVNPPYSDMEQWTEKVVSELHRDDVDTILYLCKDDTSTNWWHTAVGEASAVGMIDYRLSFGGGSSSAPFASHVFVFGDVNNAVLDVLSRRGTVFTTDHIHEDTTQSKLVDESDRNRDDHLSLQTSDTL